MKEYLELIDKWGVKPLFVIAIIWLNSRLTHVENNLQDCYNQRIIESIERSRATNRVKRDKKEPLRLVAVLPSKCKNVKECLA